MLGPELIVYSMHEECAYLYNIFNFKYVLFLFEQTLTHAFQLVSYLIL